MQISTAERAKVLTQALPYIKQYAGKTVVIKYGGNAMISEELKSAVMEDIVLLSTVGIHVVLVHGGGPEINAMLKKIGKESKFVGGLRYTDRETMDVVEMVLAGKVNKSLVQQLEQHGGRAIGLCGLDGGMIKAVKHKETDLGYVGDITHVNVTLIRNSLEKKIKNELHAMLVNDREKYETFWKAFGRQIKFGIYGDYGMHKDLLSDLLMFYSAKEQKLITLDEYIEKMPEGQKAIYFAAGDEAARLGKLPNAQLVLSKGYDLLLCSEDVDEFCLQIMHDYKEKEFKNINSGDLGLETEEEKKAAEETATENKDLFEEIKKALNGKIKDVKVNPTLQDHPVSLSSEGGISMEMEKILRKMPAGGEGMESTKVLELNPNHAVFGALKAAHEAGDTDKINKYAELLYDQALLIEGLPLEDPVAYAQLVCDLMK